MITKRPPNSIGDFTHNNDHSSRVVPLWVEDSPPYELTVLEHTMTFGRVVLSESSLALFAVITNSGFKPITIETITTDSPAFIVSHYPLTLLNPGESLKIPVIFTPDSYGLNSGNLLLSTTELGLKHVRLVGAGIWDYRGRITAALEGLWGFLVRATKPAVKTQGPWVSLSNTSVEFPQRVFVGGISDNLVFPVFNTGTQAVTLTSFAVSGDFSVLPTTTQIILPGQSIDLLLRFSPTAAGLRTGTLTFSSNTAVSLHTLTMQGLGKVAVVPPPLGKALRDTINEWLLDSDGKPLEEY